MGWLLLAVAAAVLGAAAGWRLAVRRATTDAPAESTAIAESVPLADALEEHPVGVVLVDRRGEVAFRNRAARQLQGTHVGVLVDEAVERHAAAALDGRPDDDEVLELYGPPRTVLVIEARPLQGGAAVVFVEDVSERRRIDQIRTDFVANISHELKTPVGALSVLAETLEDETDPETLRRLVARMLTEAERATRLVDDLMELSRIELGGERTREVVAVDDVVAAAVGRVTELAAQRDIGISYLGTVERPGVPDSLLVTGDRRQLVSAVGNLVENAVKYSEAGSTVHVRTRRDGAVAEIAVTDSGVGIPQRDLDRIFERFYRVDRARSRATGGTGLGLSIVRHVATNHEGEVLVSSTEGEGSTFRLRLPLGAADRPGVQASPDQGGQAEDIA